jgi:hypothetical protein
MQMRGVFVSNIFGSGPVAPAVVALGPNLAGKSMRIPREATCVAHPRLKQGASVNRVVGFRLPGWLVRRDSVPVFHKMSWSTVLGCQVASFVQVIARRERYLL